jgi:transposase-like protein
MDKTPLAPPSTLVEAVRYFASPDVCLSFMVSIRWPDGSVTCPVCGADGPRFIASRRIWQCGKAHAKRQFSIKTGTIFEDSPLGMDKWLPAVWMIVNDKNGISSYELGRAIGVTQKSAWFMLHRIRTAMQNKSFSKLRGIVEADETFIGGKLKNMHKTERLRVLGSRRGGNAPKAIIMGMLERGGEIRAHVIPDTSGDVLKGAIREHVSAGSDVRTDSWRGYRGLNPDYVHRYVNYMKEYVRGSVHTNGLENFWALLKRAIKGTYVNVEPFHLHRYVDEQAFRFNNREASGGDGTRFVPAVLGFVQLHRRHQQRTGQISRVLFDSQRSKECDSAYPDHHVNHHDR